MGKAIKNLMKEHDAILHVLKILDKMIAPDTLDDDIKLRYYKEFVYFLNIFADKCHHGKEENYLFAELLSNGISDDCGLLGELIEEHDRGRAKIALMSNALDANDINTFKTVAAKYRNLLKTHIEKENKVFFVIADRLLDEQNQEELFKKFEEYEENVIGHGVHEQLHEMIHKWEAEFDKK